MFVVLLIQDSIVAELASAGTDTRRKGRDRLMQIVGSSTTENKGNRVAITPIKVSHPEHVDLTRIRLFRQPPWVLRLTIDGDRSYTMIKIVRAAPLSHPNSYIAFLDARDEEICMVDDLTVLSLDMQSRIAEELDRRYLTSVIQGVESVRNEFGTSYWDVSTHRGQREFVVQNVAESAQWLGDFRLLIVDVDGNRFEISDLRKLDQQSQRLVEHVL